MVEDQPSAIPNAGEDYKVNKVKSRYIRRHLLLNKTFEYEPWDPSTYARPPVVERHPNTYFCVDICYGIEMGMCIFIAIAW